MSLSGEKKPAGKAGLFNFRKAHDQLLDLAFLVHDVLAHDGIVFLYFHFRGHVLLVFIGRIEVTGAGRGSQADLVSRALGHCSNPPLYFFAACPQVFQHDIDAFLVDDAQTLGGYAKFNPTVFIFHPKTVAMKVGQKTPLTLDIGVRHVISGHRSFSGDLANS
jgi:hypothetical protein